MKNRLFLTYAGFLSIIISASACKSSNHNNNSVDSIPLIDSNVSSSLLNTKVINDKKKYGTSLDIAYGKLRFGINRNELKKALPNTYYTVGKTYYLFTPLFTSDSGKLFGLEITKADDPRTANYVDNEVKNDMDNLIEVITAKYGKPDTDFGFPAFNSFQPGYIQWATEWKLGGKKTINIGIGEVSSGSQYYAVARITNDSLQRIENITNERKIGAKQKSDASKF